MFTSCAVFPRSVLVSALSALVLVVAGCSSDSEDTFPSDGGVPSAGGPAEPVALADLCKAFAAARCVGIQRCCSMASSKYPSEAACVSAEQARCKADDMPLLRNEQYAYDAQAAGDLVAAIKAAGARCQESPAVDFASLLKPDVAPGEPCTFAPTGTFADPCKGSVCTSAGKCATIPGEGQECPDGVCGEGFVCLDDLCRAPKGKGDDCLPYDDCGRGWMCMLTQEGFLEMQAPTADITRWYQCQPPRPNGERALSAEECASGLVLYRGGETLGSCAPCTSHGDCHAEDGAEGQDLLVSIDGAAGYCEEGVCKEGRLGDAAPRSRPLGAPCETRDDCRSLACEGSYAAGYGACAAPDVEALYCVGDVNAGGGDDDGGLDDPGPDGSVGPVEPINDDTQAQALWSVQFGSNNADNAQSVAVDSAGNVVVVGRTQGVIGETWSGTEDVFVTKLDASGTVLWSHQWGTVGLNAALRVAVGSDDSVFVVGQTEDDLFGASAGGFDAFVLKLTAAGTVTWSRQWGSVQKEYMQALVVAADGSVFVAGNTEGSIDGSNAGQTDALLTKLDPSGTIAWHRQWGGVGLDSLSDVRLDASGDIVVSGNTTSSLEGANAGAVDPFVSKLDASGVIQWTTQWGSAAQEQVRGLAIDAAGTIVVAGYTEGSLQGSNAGGYDAFVATLNSSGAMGWTTQWGIDVDEWVDALVVTPAGTIFVGGHTGDDLRPSNYPSNVGADGFVTRVTRTGSVGWTYEYATPPGDTIMGMALDDSGDVFVAGSTGGDLAITNKGVWDVFVAKLRDQPK